MKDDLYVEAYLFLNVGGPELKAPIAGQEGHLSLYCLTHTYTHTHTQDEDERE